MSFQITILKVLAGHPDGRAAIAELTRYVSVLMSSGPDWFNRMRGLAARAPKLDIFSDGFVLRDDTGWSITVSGRQFLAALEAPMSVLLEEPKQPADRDTTVVAEPTHVQPALRLVVDDTRRSQPGPAPGETRRSAYLPFLHRRHLPARSSLRSARPANTQFELFRNLRIPVALL